MYDVCIVGAGMVGSAAAKWLSKLHGEIKVCLIGPQEPTKEVLIYETCKNTKIMDYKNSA